MSSPCIPVLSLVAASLAALSARAEPPDREGQIAAQALHHQARAAMDRRDFESACPKLEEAARLLPDGFGIAFTLGRCYESSGRLASAWKSYSVAQALAERIGNAERSARAREHSEALRPRLATLALVVPEAVRGIAGLEVRRDGIPVGPAQWGAPIPVDRGAHVLVATAPGRGRWEKTITIAEDGAPIAEVIEAPPAVEAPPKAAAPGPIAAVSAPRAASPASPPAPVRRAPARRTAPSSETSSVQHTAGLVIGGVGVAGLGIGSAFGLDAIVNKKRGKEGLNCTAAASDCNHTIARFWGEGRTSATLSDIFFAGGGIMIGAGVLLLLTAPSPKLDRGTSVSVGPHGVEISGQW
ncbi:hypothetical protein WME90_16735 [Sorangium sp. So ce375]|uniref:tetratricopeptide repeat protein n=1 Tax=Sorangium sp. So ce375 TaxID=3133306 RepID=UPI003F5B5B69